MEKVLYLQFFAAKEVKLETNTLEDVHTKRNKLGGGQSGSKMFVYFSRISLKNVPRKRKNLKNLSPNYCT